MKFQNTLLLLFLNQKFKKIKQTSNEFFQCIHFKILYFFLLLCEIYFKSKILS
jgi:hypothetical protein